MAVAIEQEAFFNINTRTRDDSFFFLLAPDTSWVHKLTNAFCTWYTVCNTNPTQPANLTGISQALNFPAYSLVGTYTLSQFEEASDV